jgi:chromosome partitioning protein
MSFDVLESRVAKINQPPQVRVQFALTLTQMNHDDANASRGRVMLLQATQGIPRSAHVIVLGNEKGGTGKSTTAMHIAVALLKAGQRVATIDLDSRQGTFTRYVENRRACVRRTGAPLELPEHFHIARGEGVRVDENETAEFSGFAAAINTAEHTHDFVVVDTPGNDTYLMRLAHSMADTLVTPLNDSFLDFDVLGTVDPATFEVTGASHYAKMVRHARRQRRIVDGGLTDWIVLRNRLAALNSRNKKLVGQCLHSLGLRLGFRAAQGFSERVVYRELFPHGLTALDELDETVLGARPTLAHATAREEVRALIEALKLPVDERGRRRAAARAEWAASASGPLDVDDLLLDEPGRDQAAHDPGIAPGGQDATL